MIDNNFELIGFITSRFEIQNEGTKYEKYAFHLEVEGGSTPNKANVLLIAVSEKCLESLKMDINQDYSGSTVAVQGVLKSTIYKDKNGKRNQFINLDVTEIKVLDLHEKYISKPTNTTTTTTKTQTQQQTTYIPENNYGLPPQEEDEIELSDDDLPF